MCVTGTGCSWMQTALRMRDGLGRSLADRGMAARAGGDDDEAMRLLSQAAERDPDQIDIHRELACLHEEKGNGDACVRHLQRIAELESDDAESWARLAEALHEHGDLRRAGDAADRSLDLDPTNTTAMLVLAQLLEEGGRPLDALEAHHRVLDADPSNVDSRLAVARIHLDLGNADRAAPVLRSLCACPLTDDAEKCEAWWSLGIAYGRIGRWTDAVRALETGTENHNTADDWYRLAFARRAAGDVEGVREALREIRQRDATHDGGRKLANLLAANESNVRTVSAEGGLPVPRGWEAMQLQ